MTLLIWLAASSLLWGGVLWIAGRTLQRSTHVSGAARQWIWRGATALLLAPWIAAPFVVMFGLGLAPAETVASTTVAATPTTEMLAAMHAIDAANVQTAVVSNGGGVLAWLGQASLPELVIAVFIAGLIVRFVLAQLALRSLLGIVNVSREAEPGIAKSFVQSWAHRLKLRPAPRLRIVAEQHSPFSYGILRPTICVPEGMEEKLNRGSLDLVVGHESLHIARGDGWLRPVERVTADILWFNPFAWLIRRELDVARELAVDEAVLAMSSARVAYARTLRDVAGFAAGLSATAPAASMSLPGGRNLMMRVSRTLAHAGKKPARATLVAACLLGLAAAPIAIAQVMMAVPAPPATPPFVPEVEAVVPVAPVEPVAPIAPPAPVAPPTPRPTLAPLAAPSPMPPANLVAPLAPTSPVTPKPMRAPVAPVPPTPVTPMVAPVAPTPVTPVTPMVAPTAPPAPPVWNNYQPTAVTPPPLKTPERAVIQSPARVTSVYGERVDPISQKQSFHDGVDIAAPIGVAVHTPVAGQVVFAGVKGDRGNSVEVLAANGQVVSLAQLGSISVKVGAAVIAGDVVGTIGSSGRSTGPHLHLGVTVNGAARDPQKVEGLALIAG